MKKRKEYIQSDVGPPNEVPLIFESLLNKPIFEEWENAGEEIDNERDRKKKARLARKIMLAATYNLTDIQFKIFVMRFVYDMRESEIANQVHCNQSYVSAVLRHSVTSIRKALRIYGKKGKKATKLKNIRKSK